MKIVLPQLLERFSAFCITRSFVNVFSTAPPLAPILRHLSPAVTFRLYILQNAATERSYYPTPNHQEEGAPFISCPQLLVLMPFISGSHVLLLQSEGLVTRNSLNNIVICLFFTNLNFKTLKIQFVFYPGTQSFNLYH